VNTERALQIIAAYGADAGRWPDDERAAVLALVATVPQLATAQADARGLDALLADWARDVLPARFDVSGMVRPLPVARGGRGMTRWIAGGVLAAALAAGIVIFAPMQPASVPAGQSVSTGSPVLSATAEREAYGSDAEVFAHVFTPTVDEDELI
jgi:hypothetical protein